MKKFAHTLSAYSTTFRTIRRNLLGKKFEPEVYILDKFIKPGAICFDVGAAYGRYTLVMSRLAGAAGRIYCFEPGDYSYQVLNNVVKFHRLKNVTLLKKGLSDEPGFVKLSIPLKNKGKLGASLAHLGPAENANYLSQAIEVTTIDDYCLSSGINRLDFIKCDVEGAELLVVKGGEKIINTCKPTVFCEVEKDFLRRFGFLSAQLYGFFEEKGYKAYVLEENKLEEVNQIENNGNYFFIAASNLFFACVEKVFSTSAKIKR